MLKVWNTHTIKDLVPLKERCNYYPLHIIWFKEAYFLIFLSIVDL